MPSQLLATNQSTDLSYLQPQLQSAPYVSYPPPNRLGQHIPARNNAAAQLAATARDPFQQQLCMSSILVQPPAGLTGKFICVTRLKMCLEWVTGVLRYSPCQACHSNSNSLTTGFDRAAVAVQACLLTAGGQHSSYGDPACPGHPVAATANHPATGANPAVCPCLHHGAEWQTNAHHRECQLCTIILPCE